MIHHSDVLAFSCVKFIFAQFIAEGFRGGNDARGLFNPWNSGNKEGREKPPVRVHHYRSCFLEAISCNQAPAPKSAFSCNWSIHWMSRYAVPNIINVSLKRNTLWHLKKLRCEWKTFY